MSFSMACKEHPDMIQPISFGQKHSLSQELLKLCKNMADPRESSDTIYPQKFSPTSLWLDRVPGCPGPVETLDPWPSQNNQQKSLDEAAPHWEVFLSADSLLSKTPADILPWFIQRRRKIWDKMAAIYGDCNHGAEQRFPFCRLFLGEYNCRYSPVVAPEKEIALFGTKWPLSVATATMVQNRGFLSADFLGGTTPADKTRLYLWINCQKRPKGTRVFLIQGPNSEHAWVGLHILNPGSALAASLFLWHKTPSVSQVPGKLDLQSTAKIGKGKGKPPPPPNRLSKPSNENPGSALYTVNSGSALVLSVCGKKPRLSLLLRINYNLRGSQGE